MILSLLYYLSIFSITLTHSQLSDGDMSKYKADDMFRKLLYDSEGNSIIVFEDGSGDIYCKQNDYSISMVGVSLGTDCWNLFKIVLRLNDKEKSKFEGVEVIPMTEKEYEVNIFGKSKNIKPFIDQFFTDKINKIDTLNSILAFYYDSSKAIQVHDKNSQSYSLSTYDGKVMCKTSQMEPTTENYWYSRHYSTHSTNLWVYIYDDKKTRHIARFEQRLDKYIFKGLEEDIPMIKGMSKSSDSDKNIPMVDDMCESLLPLENFIDDQQNFYLDPAAPYFDSINTYIEEISTEIEKAREYIKDKIKIDESLCDIYRSSEKFRSILSIVLREMYTDKIKPLEYELNHKIIEVINCKASLRPRPRDDDYYPKIQEVYLLFFVNDILDGGDISLIMYPHILTFLKGKIGEARYGSPIGDCWGSGLGSSPNFYDFDKYSERLQESLSFYYPKFQNISQSDTPESEVHNESVDSSVSYLTIGIAIFIVGILVYRFLLTNN